MTVPVRLATTLPVSPHATLVSAHRGGVGRAAPPTDLAGFQAAVDRGCELVEFDVRTTSDDHLVVYHNPRVPSGEEVSSLTLAEVRTAAECELPTVEELLGVLAGRSLAHIDLKEIGGEGRIVELARKMVGDDGFVLTTLEDESVVTIRRLFPKVAVGLSLGRDMTGASPWRYLTTRLSEIFPNRRVAQADPTFLTVHYRLAGLNVLRFARRHGLPVWVWTIDEERLWKRFFVSPEVAVVITNLPKEACGTRDGAGDSERDSAPVASAVKE